jgi:hypothetical protein
MAILWLSSLGFDGDEGVEGPYTDIYEELEGVVVTIARC